MKLCDLWVNNLVIWPQWDRGVGIWGWVWENMIWKLSFFFCIFCFLNLGLHLFLQKVISKIQKHRNKNTETSLYSRPLVYAAAAAKLLQSCPTLCDPIDGSPPGSPAPGILQARTLEWVAISFSNAWKWKVKRKSLSRVRLSDPMDYSLPGSSIHGIFQARGLEWGAIAFSNSILSILRKILTKNGRY